MTKGIIILVPIPINLHKPHKISMKKSISTVLLFSIFLYACTNSTDSKEEVIYQSVQDTASASIMNDSAIVIQNSPILWRVEMEKNSQFEKLKKPSDSRIETMSAEAITKELNNDFEDITLQLISTSHDTAFVKIADGEKFTNRIGSTGAYNYLATVVYNLTEMKNIKYVNFDFKEGDHAVPGVFTREDFKNLR